MSNAQAVITAILAGQSPSDVEAADLGKWTTVIGEMVRAHQDGGTVAARRVFDACAAKDADLAALIAGDADEDLVNPLEVQHHANLQLGWIDEYTALMTRLTGSPREFNQLCGLVTAAAAIQRRAKLAMAFGDIYPNIYGAIVAPSSVYHKTGALSKPRALLRRANLDDLLMPETGTSEGWLRQLSMQSSGLIIRDEIGTLFSSHGVKYLANLKPDLTALYDCLPYSKRLSNELIRVESPYLNILGATTPTRFFESVTATDWRDGFLARWLFVLPEGEPDFDAMTGLYTAEHDAEIGRLSTALVNIDAQRETNFVLRGNAHKLWDSWQRKAAKDAFYFGDDVTAAIVTRYAAYALKFAIILAAVNGSWGDITEHTMQTAIELADNYKLTAHKLLSEKQNFGISGAKLQKVFLYIQQKGGADGATSRDISRFANLRKADVEPCIEKLLEIGAIVEKPNGRTMRYVTVAKELPVKAWK